MSALENSSGTKSTSTKQEEKIAEVESKTSDKANLETQADDQKQQQEQKQKFSSANVSCVKLIDKGNYVLIPSKLDPEKNKNVIKILCISDTHSKHTKLETFVKEFPNCDILIHTGDITSAGNFSGFKSYSQWLSKLKQENKFKHSLLIAGNHDLHLDVRYKGIWQHNKRIAKQCVDYIRQECVAHYLKDESIELYGIKFYGSPYTPEFADFAFNLKRGPKLAKKWSIIPQDTNILLTHGPPKFHGDLVMEDDETNKSVKPVNAGDLELLKRIDAIGTIDYHLFGHIHEGYGVTKYNGIDNTTFVNAASVDVDLNAVHKPIMFYVEGKQDENNQKEKEKEKEKENNVKKNETEEKD